MDEKLFALILLQHRLWGYVIIPYIIQKESNQGYYRLSECLSPYPGADTLGSLSAEERELVKIINEYSDKILYKLFSKDKSVKDFLEKVTPDKFDGFIRPYIERRLFKCFSIARIENIPVYFRKKKAGTLHPEDKILLCDENAEPVFKFDKGIEQSFYSLSLEYKGKMVDLRNETIEILCNTPCIIKDDNRLIFVSDIDGSKLKPFFTRDSIIIPLKSELKYFSGFVLNTINNFKVENSGFDIIEITPAKESLLRVETALNGKTVLTLQFDYEGNKIYSNEPSSTFTIFENQSGKFIFKNYKRDFLWEKKCIESLAGMGFFSEDDIHFVTAENGSDHSGDFYAILEVINSNYSDIIDSGFRLSSALSGNYNLRPVDLEISSQIINDWFDIRAIVKIDQWSIPFSHFRKNILEGIREFILPDKSIAILPDTWFSKYKNIFEFGKTTDESLRVHKQHFSLLPDAFNEEGKAVYGRLEKLLIPDNIPTVTSPAGLNCTMRQYQEEGLNWLSFLQKSGLGGCLADDMGLGKTIQTLALLQYNKENIQSSHTINEGESDLFSGSTPGLTSLIVVPASLIYNWEHEIRRFVPGMTVYSYKGNQRKKNTTYFHNYDIILSSYHTVRQDIDMISSFSFHYIILDESQVIKNPASMLYRTVTRLLSEYKLVLTGTPVENSLTDLWTQLNFVNPGLLGDLAFFRREFARPIEKMGDEEKEEKLRKIIKPFILRRTKEKVAPDLPPVSEQTVYCNMTDEQFRVYDEEKSSVRNSILKSISSSGSEKTAIVVLQGLMKLRQLSNHPLLTNDDYDSGSGKFETVLQDMESVMSEGHKILVFSSFVKHLELYAEELRKKRIRFAMLTGASTDREKIVNSFQLDPENKIFLISLKAGGVGLNLTAADYVFILDPWWNPASEMQALNRAHRIGQDKNVFVYRYITSDTIEEKILRLQEKKSKLADIFISSSNPLKEIDIHEILEIIG